MAFERPLYILRARGETLEAWSPCEFLELIDCALVAGDRGQPFRVEVVDDELSRVRLWELADHVFPVYAAYREKAARVGRAIPILQLVPR